MSVDPVCAVLSWSFWSFWSFWSLSLHLCSWPLSIRGSTGAHLQPPCRRPRTCEDFQDAAWFASPKYRFGVLDKMYEGSTSRCMMISTYIYILLVWLSVLNFAECLFKSHLISHTLWWQGSRMSCGTPPTSLTYESERTEHLKHIETQRRSGEALEQWMFRQWFGETQKFTESLWDWKPIWGIS